MRIMAAGTNAWTGALSDSSFALCVDGISKVAQANTSTDCSDAGALIKLDRLERLKVDLHRTVLATGAEAGI